MEPAKHVPWNARLDGLNPFYATRTYVTHFASYHAADCFTGVGSLVGLNGVGAVELAINLVPRQPAIRHCALFWDMA